MTIEERCPICGSHVLFEYDSDGVKQWLHEVWRTCPHTAYYPSQKVYLYIGYHPVILARIIKSFALIEEGTGAGI